MQLESLSLFLEVIECKSITKAAQKLFITPQGASSAIKALEKQLDTKLFERTGSTIQPTRAGMEIAAEAERVVSAYQRLQSAAALQANRTGGGETLRVVTTPFTHQTFTFVIQEYAERIGANQAVEIIEKNSFEIAHLYEHLEDGTLYILDLPLDMRAASDVLPKNFLQDIMDRTVTFRPFALSHFMVKCSETNAHAAQGIVRWSDLDPDEIACHDDPFLLKIVGTYAPQCKNGNVGMKVSNTDLMNAAINQSGMLGVTASVPVIFHNRTWKRTLDGIALEPKPTASFVTGVLASPGSAHGPAFALYMKRLLGNLFPGYVKKNDPDEFFKKNALRPGRTRNR